MRRRVALVRVSAVGRGTTMSLPSAAVEGNTMAERETDTEDRGITRRDALRRGAVIGGTLIWAAPAVQTLARPAFAGSLH
jgi:hypothetical protein